MVMMDDTSRTEHVIILEPDYADTSLRLREALEIEGGRILHRFGPRVLIVELRSGSEDVVRRKLSHGVLAQAFRTSGIASPQSRCAR